MRKIGILLYLSFLPFRRVKIPIEKVSNTGHIVFSQCFQRNKHIPNNHALLIVNLDPVRYSLHTDLLLCPALQG